MRNMVMGLAATVFVLLAAAAIFLAVKEPEGPFSPAMVNVAGAEIGGPFVLTDQNGAEVNSASLINGPVLIYFGYTFCPDICPVDVAVMADAVDLLAEQGHQVTPIFITVDPERDTTEALAYYADAMHPRMVALTGSGDDIAAVANAYKVFYERVDLEESAAGYLMNHSIFTYLMTPEGLKGVFRNGFPAEEIAGAVARILSRG